jgi:hypothetical protein
MLKVIETSAIFDRAVSLMEKSDRRDDNSESLNPEEKVLRASIALGFAMYAWAYLASSGSSRPQR